MSECNYCKGYEISRQEWQTPPGSPMLQGELRPCPECHKKVTVEKRVCNGCGEPIPTGSPCYLVVSLTMPEGKIDFTEVGPGYELFHPGHCLCSEEHDCHGGTEAEED